jgi:hypothetical protein
MGFDPPFKKEISLRWDKLHPADYRNLLDFASVKDKIQAVLVERICQVLQNCQICYAELNSV